MISFFSFSDEMEKIALPRYEKEIAKGTITRDQVVPSPVISPEGASQVWLKKYTRDHLYDPAISAHSAPVGAPANLGRIREINQKSFEANRANPQIRGATGASTEPKHMPVMGPATTAGTVFLPDDSGKFLRQAGEASGFKGKAQLIASTFNSPRVDTFTGYDKVPTLPVDKTLNRAVGLHEMGELHTSTFPDRHPGGGPLQAAAPVSGHLGVRPLLEERLATRQDPEARKIMHGVRMGSYDDALIQRALRRAGSNPFNPIPGGKHEAAALREVHRNADKLNPMARSNAFSIAAGTGGNVRSYVPDDVVKGMKGISKASLGDKLRAAAKVFQFIKGKKQ